MSADEEIDDARRGAVRRTLGQAVKSAAATSRAAFARGRERPETAWHLACMLCLRNQPIVGACVQKHEEHEGMGACAAGRDSVLSACTVQAAGWDFDV